MRAFPAWVFLFVSVLLCVPILLHPHLPLVDLPNHIARLYIASTTGSALDEYYSYNLTFQTNIAIDIIWLTVGHWFMSVEAFSNSMFAIYAVTFIASIMILSRVVHGRWQVWPLVSNLVVFNSAYFWGFENYLITVSIAMFALAFWLRMENRSHFVRVLVFTPVCLLLYAMHLLGLLIFVVAVFGREVHIVIIANQNWAITLKRNLILGVPFLLPMAVILVDLATKPPNLFGSGTYFGTLSERLQIITSPGYSVMSDWPSAFNVFGSIILVVLITLLLTTRRKHGPRLNFHAKMTGPVIAISALAICSPTVLNGVHESIFALHSSCLARSLLQQPGWI